MKAYYYLFFKLYQFWEFASIPAFWSDFKAAISITGLEIWLFFTLLNIGDLITNQKLEAKITDPIFIIPIGFIIVTNFLLFIYSDEWKEHNEEFKHLPRYKNIIGGFIIWLLIIVITFGFFYSTHITNKKFL